jgi:ankyrin repeat protein
MENSKRLH